MPTTAKVTDVFPTKKRGRAAAAKGKAKAKAAETVGIKRDEEDPDEEIRKILKTFDMTSKFGPALGLSRIERWERAKSLHLDPPAEVRRILAEREGDEWNECVWERIV